MNTEESLKAQTHYTKAIKWATKAHKEQMYDDLPYVYHLMSVDEVLTRFGFSIAECMDLHIASLCHDVVEDHKAKLSEVIEQFGENVGLIVNYVTDEKGFNRKERHEKTYPILAQSEDAVIVKLCDRIANVEYGLATGNAKQFKKYLREYKFFRDTLKKKEHTRTVNLWKHLDGLFEWDTWFSDEE